MDWLGIAHIVLLREIETDGVSKVFTVLLAVFADDTVAQPSAGRPLRRHKLARRSRPGRRGGLRRGVGGGRDLGDVDRAFTDTGFMDGYRSIVLGAVIADAALLGDLFESALKRDAEVKDAGRLSALTACSTSARRAPVRAAAAYYVIAAFGFA